MSEPKESALGRLCGNLVVVGQGTVYLVRSPDRQKPDRRGAGIHREHIGAWV
jgi:hypothetical protein